jgi:YNFM family putative membrane transporter
MTSTARVVFILAVAAFASTSAFRVFDPALPALTQEFGITTGQAADVVLWFALAYGVLQFFYGPLGDRFGKYRVLSYATLGCVIGSLVVALAPSFEAVLIGRFLSGAAGAGIIPLSLAWIGDHVPYENRQATLSRFVLGNILGVTFGLAIGGFFTDTVGWRGAFYFLALVYLLVGLLLISQRKLVDELQTTTGKLEILGPILEVLRVPWARVVLLAVMFEGALVFGSLAYVPAYLQWAHGLSSTQAGLLASLFSVGALLYVVRAPWLIKLLGEVRMAMTGGAILSVCYLMYWLGPQGVWPIMAGILCGLGYYFLHAVLQARATQMAARVRGTAVSLFACFMFIGQALGVGAGAWLVDQYSLASVLIVAAVTLPLLGVGFGVCLMQHIRHTQSA